MSDVDDLVEILREMADEPPEEPSLNDVERFVNEPVWRYMKHQMQSHLVQILHVLLPDSPAENLTERTLADAAGMARVLRDYLRLPNTLLMQATDSSKLQSADEKED